MTQTKPISNWLLAVRVVSASVAVVVLSGCELTVGRYPPPVVGEAEPPSTSDGSIETVPKPPVESAAQGGGVSQIEAESPPLLYSVQHSDQLSVADRAVVTDLYRTGTGGGQPKLIFTDRDEPWLIQSTGGVIPNNRVLLSVGDRASASLSPDAKLVTIATDGSGAWTSVNDHFIAPFSPVVSRDGQRLAVVEFETAGDRSAFQLVTMNLDGTQRRELLRSDQPITSLSWHHSGTRVAFLRSAEPGQTTLEMVDVQTGALERVSSFDGQGVGLDWGVNGLLAVLTQAPDRRNHLTVIDQQGRLRQTIPGSAFATPQFSRDAQAIAYISFEATPRAGQPVPLGSVQFTPLELPDGQSNFAELSQGYSGSTTTSSESVADERATASLGQGTTIVGWLR